MSLTINTNTTALDAYRNLSVTNNMMSQSLERLSSGFRINKAADDAAGLAISDGLESQVEGIQQASRNSQDGINVLQTADGALSETTSILQRMRTLAVQAANTGSNDSSSKADMQTEVKQLKAELDSIASHTTFNNVALLDGKFSGASATFQVGYAAGDTIAVAITTSGTGGGFGSTALGLSSVDLTTGASSAITSIDAAIKEVDTARATIGAQQNRFQDVVDRLNVAVENLSASESQIKDTDMAAEMTNFSKLQILQQAGMSMLAQANQAPQSILKLLQ
jgi:flagellin